ncbi:MAG: hypothetical protein ABFS56_24360 [Pseudomonadota bacterium]
MDFDLAGFVFNLPGLVFKDIESVVEEAQRRYLESHPTDLMEQFIQE